MYSTRSYRLKFTEDLLGTIPKNTELFSKFVLSKYPDPEDKKDLDLSSEVDMQGQEKETGSLLDGSGQTGFHTDPDGIYLLDYHLKGFFKEAGNNLKKKIETTGRRTFKIAALRSKIDNYLFVRPRYIWLAEKPDGVLERSIRVNTMKGPRVGLTRSDYVKRGTEIDFTVLLVDHDELSWDVVEYLLDYGQLKGLGQWRNGSWGSFVWKRTDDKKGTAHKEYPEIPYERKPIPAKGDS